MALSLTKTAQHVFFLLVALICFFFPRLIFAAEEVHLVWDQNTESDLAGYKLFIGTSSGDYQSSIDVGLITSYLMEGLAAQTTYYFALIAYDNTGNSSDFSEEIVVTTSSAEVTEQEFEEIIDSESLPEELEEAVNEEDIDVIQNELENNEIIGHNDDPLSPGQVPLEVKPIVNSIEIVAPKKNQSEVKNPQSKEKEIDLCPDDKSKSSPGKCGCGVVEDLKDLDRDGIANCLDTDRDGDGVSDAQELLDGTNFLDFGSVKQLVGTTVCTEWNGFLGQLWNILELINMSSAELSVEVSLLNSDGGLVERFTTPVVAHAQRDVLVHTLSGRRSDQYGLVCLKHNKRPNDLDGRMVYYKENSSKSDFQQFDFAFAMPFSNGFQGSQYVTFNTYHPSSRSQDRINGVANWIQLTNLGSKKEQGRLVFYSMNGTILGEQIVTIVPNQRIDFSGHQFGPDKVGHVAWIPKSSRSLFQLRNVRYLYDNPDGRSSFDTAFQLEGSHPSGERLLVPLDLDQKTAVVEAVNVTGLPVAATIELYSDDGRLQSEKKFYLEPHNSIHLIANELMKDAVKGLAIIKGSRHSSIVAMGMQYIQKDDGSVSYMFGLPAKQAVGLILKNSYNTYLDQSSILVLSSCDSKKVDVSLSLIRSDGEKILSNYQIAIPAHGVKEININEFSSANQYGVVEVKTKQVGKIVAWVKRVRSDEYIMPTPSR